MLEINIYKRNLNNVHSYNRYLAMIVGVFKGNNFTINSIDARNTTNFVAFPRYSRSVLIIF